VCEEEKACPREKEPLHQFTGGEEYKLISNGTCEVFASKTRHRGQEGKRNPTLEKTKFPTRQKHIVCGVYHGFRPREHRGATKQDGLLSSSSSGSKSYEDIFDVERRLANSVGLYLGRQAAVRQDAIQMCLLEHRLGNAVGCTQRPGFSDSRSGTQVTKPAKRSSSPAVGGPAAGRTYLNCPKDSAKSLGAKWDPEQKSWYIPPDLVALKQY
jgi:hypothetical protein